MIISSFATVVLLLFSLSFAYVSHHICLVLAAAPPHYLLLPISLNSLDLVGVRLLSPRDSPDTSKTVAGAEDTSACDATELKWDFDEELSRYYVSFPVDQ